MNQDIISLFHNLKEEVHLIDPNRQLELKKMADVMNESLNSFESAKVIFVCTHNSRRSTLGQIMLRTAATYLGLDNIYTFSGGTEGTAFNHRMVAAIERAGYIVEKMDDWDNPKYLVHLSGDDSNMDIHYSKPFNENYNPSKDFIAIMVCSEADEACPFVPGAFARISLPYKDPKEFDDTVQEEKAYDDKIREIGREMLYTLSLLKKIK